MLPEYQFDYRKARPNRFAANLQQGRADFMKAIELPQGLEWEKLLEELKTQDVVLTHEGHAVALLSEFHDDEMYWHARENDPKFIASIASAREKAAKGQTT